MMQREGFDASHACQIARVSRAGFYRHYEQHEPRHADVALRDVIQKIALENRFYGYRRVTAELQHRGTVVNHKTGIAVDARRQSVGGSQAEICLHYGFTARLRCVSRTWRRT